MSDLLFRSLEHIKKLMNENTVPILEGDLSEIPALREIHDEIKTIREILSSFSSNYEENLPTLTESLRRRTECLAAAMETLLESESRYKYLANHDPLTGAMNRRSFIERVKQELNEALRHKTSCGVIMMDIDHFKIFNDTYGHQAGDEALRQFVRIVTDSSRRHDFLGRYGGEEFILFFSHADKTASIIIAERIREAIENNPIHLEIAPVTITASLGIALAELPEEMDFGKISAYLEVLIKNADMAMYQAKKEGRNKVVFYEG